MNLFSLKLGREIFTSVRILYDYLCYYVSSHSSAFAIFAMIYATLAVSF